MKIYASPLALLLLIAVIAGVSASRKLKTEQAALKSTLSLLLGVAEDYKDIYPSRLAYPRDQEVAASQAASLLGNHCQPNLSTAITEAQNVDGTHVVEQRNRSYKANPVTDAVGSSHTSRLDSLNRAAGTDATITVYKSPW